MRIIHTPSFCRIESDEEQYGIHVTSTSNSGEELELDNITITLPPGTKWTGNIQDFKAMQTYMFNAFKFISLCGGQPEELTEIKTMLAHFGQTVELPAESPERSKELALISCIMTHNYFEDMMKHSRTQCMVHCYDLIADWAGEFYDKYRFHTNWEDAPADFPGATGWEDSICIFTHLKMSEL